MMPSSEPLQPEAPTSAPAAPRASGWARVTWALVSLFVAESLVFGLSVVPATAFWETLYGWPPPAAWVRPVLLAMWGVTAYIVFAICFMTLSAITARTLRWRTPPGSEMRIADLGWPLLAWARYAAMTHLVRILVGLVFKGTPLWTVYMRLNGARVGRGVYVNSLGVTDHCLLDLGDDVVIGADVHLSGHTVEAGVVKTAGVKLGSGVTVGVGSVIGIGVEIGPGAQVGALSLVPKHRKLEGGMIYTGIPVQATGRSGR